MCTLRLIRALQETEPDVSRNKVPPVVAKVSWIIFCKYYFKLIIRKPKQEIYKTMV